MKNRILSIACLLTALLLADIASAEMYVFPNNGQNRAQQDKDEGACHVWAVNRTGFDPAYASVPQAAPPPSGAAVGHSAAKGALIGGAIGSTSSTSSSSSARRGAAYGAAAGVAMSRGRQRRQQQQMAAEQQALQAEQDRKRNEYLRAKSACLEGKGYTVK